MHLGLKIIAKLLDYDSFEKKSSNTIELYSQTFLKS